MFPCKAKDVHSGKLHVFKFSERQRNSNFTQHNAGMRQALSLQVLGFNKASPHILAVLDRFTC